MKLYYLYYLEVYCARNCGCHSFKS